MHKTIIATVYKETPDGTWFQVLVPRESLTDEVKRLCVNGKLKGELRIDDGRHITAEQRKKVYATIGDMADFFGYPPEELKEIMKYRYIAATGADYFSFSDCSITTARYFINHILDFALEWNVPLMELLTNRTDDINAAIYSSLKHRRCIICGADGDIHHWDPIGIGRDRDTVDDSKMRKLCLCRAHHTEAHTIGHNAFETKHHVYGIVYVE
jgi:hypothetical protein